MKNKLFLYTALSMLVLASCNNDDNKPQESPVITGAPAADTTKHDTVLIDSAKAQIANANKWVEKGMRSKLPVEKVNDQLRPIMSRYRALILRMKPADTLLVHQYRIDEVNKLINLQIELDSKKK